MLVQLLDVELLRADAERGLLDADRRWMRVVHLMQCNYELGSQGEQLGRPSPSNA
jgi:hypothetical protein